jgi:wyosine [tRNA(Phe)-imidazoG37] synthetase (radical SAM superfamily)
MNNQIPLTLHSPLRRFVEQIYHSMPHYLEELKNIRSPHDLYSWLYFKFPNHFPLANFPICIGIEITNVCNFSCKHCWRSIMTRRIGSIDVNLFDKIISEVSLSGPRIVKIAGAGEPALHPRFNELMSSLRPHNIKVISYTNGTLLQMYSHQEILKWNINTLVVSVDGIDVESYERIRVGGKLIKLRNSLRDFFNLRNSSGSRLPQIEIRHVIMPNETSDQLRQFRNSWLAISDTVKFNYLTLLTEEKAVQHWRPKCRDIRRESYILWDGSVPLCGHEYKHEYIGNLHTASIQELWQHPRKEFVRECHNRSSLKEVPLCINCPP